MRFLQGTPCKPLDKLCWILGGNNLSLANLNEFFKIKLLLLDLR